MPTIALTDEEIAAAIRYFSNHDLREYMRGVGSNKSVPLHVADSILEKLKRPLPDPQGAIPKKTNPRVDAIWNAVAGSAGRSNT